VIFIRPRLKLLCIRSTFIILPCIGTLVDSYDGVQCCGGQVVSTDLVCCGDAVSGHSYVTDTAKYCCGQQYVDVLTTHCCTDRHGRSQVTRNGVCPSVRLSVACVDLTRQVRGLGSPELARWKHITHVTREPI